MNRMKTDEEVQEILSTYGYKKFGPYLGANKPIKCMDCDGYIVYPTLSHLYSGKVPLRYHKSNPSAIHDKRLYYSDNYKNKHLIKQNTLINK